MSMPTPAQRPRPLRYHNRGPVTVLTPLFVGDIYYAFTANQDIRCDRCGRTIPTGEEFTRREWGQRSERFSRWPECRQCRPFSCGTQMENEDHA